MRASLRCTGILVSKPTIGAKSTVTSELEISTHWSLSFKSLNGGTIEVLFEEPFAQIWHLQVKNPMFVFFSFFAYCLIDGHQSDYFVFPFVKAFLRCRTADSSEGDVKIEL